MSQRQRIAEYLKRHGPSRANDLATSLGVTVPAVRQHLGRLEASGEVAWEDVHQGVGRPARHYRLTPQAEARFPDAHDALSSELIGAMQDAFGAQGLARIIEARTERQLARYRLVVDAGELGERVVQLAEQRAHEGYMAIVEDTDGGWLLIEQHCPICVAAKACQGLCAGELELFRRVLGPAVTVTRIEHMLGDGRRCTYRIEPN